MREGKVQGYPMPGQVAQALEGYRKQNKEVSNFGLFFHRFLRYPEEWSLEGKRKNEAWKRVERTMSIYRKGYMGKICAALKERMRSTVDSYKNMRFHVSEPVEGTVSWRLAIGLATPSVFEVGISLHRVYGIPYIPATAVKGLTQAYRMHKIAEKFGIKPLNLEEHRRRKEQERKTPLEKLEEYLMKPKKDREKIIEQLKADSEVKKENARILNMSLGEIEDECKPEDFRSVFGTENLRGEVIFFDALLLELTVDGKPILELDVMTPHYGDYYTDEKGEVPPADYLTPNPVMFLTIRRGTRFRFYLVSKSENLLTEVKSWLKEALREFGIGAKTSAGYGEMR